MNLWPLRVLNEDRVDAYTGFDTHSHQEFEIFSYVVEGELEHKDSLGNTEHLPRGALQLTSAGTGISHSEKAHGSSPVYFIQIWAKPWKSSLTPKYYTRRFSDSEKLDKWVTVVAPCGSEGVNEEREGSGPAPVQSALTMYATIPSPGMTLDRPLRGTKAYVHASR
ncbi:RmlC-like cupin domain-containing protein [Cyathus striatus]|nr:RmlC-like cupin domain-containing protein [Cyathus striatus]